MENNGSQKWSTVWKLKCSRLLKTGGHCLCHQHWLLRAMQANRKSPIQRFKDLPARPFCDRGQHLPSLGLGYPFSKVVLSDILNLFWP